MNIFYLGKKIQMIHKIKNHINKYANEVISIGIMLLGIKKDSLELALMGMAIFLIFKKFQIIEKKIENGKCWY